MEIIKTDGVNNETTTAGFKRTETSSKALTEGEKIYADLGKDSDKLGSRIVELGEEMVEVNMVVMMEGGQDEVDRLDEMRLIFNGIMDAAGEANNPAVSLEMNELLNEYFGLDTEDEEWMDHEETDLADISFD